MFKSVKKKVTHRTKKNWGVVIAEAERQLAEARTRAAKLEETVGNFKRLRDEGLPLPGAEEAGTAA
jgi:hypothetical protein